MGFEALSDSALPPGISLFRMQELANMAWAFAMISFEDKPLITAISQCSHDRLDECSIQHLANLVWAFATLSVNDVPLLAAIAPASHSKLSPSSEDSKALTI